VLIVFDLVDSNAGKPATYFVGILQIKIKIKIKICHNQPSQLKSAMPQSKLNKPTLLPTQ
jgi:hypothetical protein